MQPFTVACAQVRARDLADAELALQDILHALDEAGQAGAQLVALPECSYPAYYLGDSDPYAKPGVRPFPEVCDLFAAKARQYGYWLAAGMAAPTPDGRLANSGIVFDPTGAIAGRYDKSFLWHFDTEWFTPGTEFPVWDTGFCRFGILICADSRQPEIPRALALNGAEVILDLTAWVSWARNTTDLTTTQCEYLMPARAFENGVWIAAADKWGPEQQSIVYAGRSTVIDPAGVTRVCAPSDAETVVVYQVEPQDPYVIPRRPDLYGLLTAPTADLPVTALLAEPLVPADENRRIAIAPGMEGFNARAIVERYTLLRRQGADLVVFPGLEGPEGWQVDLATIEAAVAAHGGAVAFAVGSGACTRTEDAVVITPQGSFEHQSSHGRGVLTAGRLPAIVPTPAGNVALLCNDEGYVPEVARCLALSGADILAWSLFREHPMTERIARTRADENHVYTAAAWPQSGLVVSPSGGVLTASPHGSGIAMAASSNKALARWKDMAPGTNVIRDRKPEAYAALTRVPLNARR